MYRFSVVLSVFLVALGVLLIPAQRTEAACLGGTPVWKTGDTEATCKYKQRIKRDIKRKKVDAEIEALELKRDRVGNNQGAGSGSGNSNVFLNTVDSLLGKKSGDTGASPTVFSRHQVRFGLIPLVIPGAPQMDSPGPPATLSLIPNEIAYEYYVSKNLGFGLIWEEWSRTDGRTFDPIMGSRPDGSGDTPIYFPGEVNELKYTLYMPTIILKADIATSWRGVLRFGVGQQQVEVKYKQIDKEVYPFARQPENIINIDSTAILIDIGLEKLYEGIIVGGVMRYISSRTDTSDYQQYMNLGSAKVLFYVQFMLPVFGIL